MSMAKFVFRRLELFFEKINISEIAENLDRIWRDFLSPLESRCSQGVSVFRLVDEPQQIVTLRIERIEFQPFVDLFVGLLDGTPLQQIFCGRKQTASSTFWVRDALRGGCRRCALCASSWRREQKDQNAQGTRSKPHSA